MGRRVRLRVWEEGLEGDLWLVCKSELKRKKQMYLYFYGILEIGGSYALFLISQHILSFILI